MNIEVLIIVGLAAAGAVVWLIHYLPLQSKIFNIIFSPKLLFCKLLIPFDTTITIFLIAGAWIGVTAITGIGMMIYNVSVGIGLSLGTVFTRKILAPKWKAEYKRLNEYQN